MKVTRRSFLWQTGCAASAAWMHPPSAFAGHGSLQSRLAADRLRPQFHLLPAANWMNDSLIAESPNPRKTPYPRMFIA